MLFHQRSRLNEVSSKKTVIGLHQLSRKSRSKTGVLRGGPGGTSGTGPGFFRGARNFRNSARYIYTKIKKMD